MLTVFVSDVVVTAVILNTTFIPHLPRQSQQRSDNPFGDTLASPTLCVHPFLSLLSVAVATLPMIMNNVVLLCRETRYIKTKLAALSYQATASPCRTSRGSTRGPTPASPATTWPGWRASPYTSTSSVSQTCVDL